MPGVTLGRLAQVMQLSVEEFDSSERAVGAQVLMGLAIGSRVAAPGRLAASAQRANGVQGPFGYLPAQRFMRVSN